MTVDKKADVKDYKSAVEEVTETSGDISSTRQEQVLSAACHS